MAVWDTWMVASAFSSQWNDEQGVLFPYELNGAVNEETPEIEP
jgi:hypothetical protein